MSEEGKVVFEISVQTKDLVPALGFAGSVVEKRNVMQELSNIKLVARDGVLEIGATDMDLYLNQEIGAEVFCPGQTTVSTQTFADIVRKMPDSTIKIKQLEGSDKVEIKGSNCRFELLTLPANAFPVMEDVDANSALKIACVELARVIEYTSFSISTEETRYNLNGVYMHVKGREFLGVSTDGHRLSVASVILEKESKDFGVIVPRKTVLELVKILKDSKNINSDIELFFSATKVKFKCNNLILISKLIDGTFPEYSAFIPTENESKLKINSKLLSSAIDRVATVTVDKFRAVKMSLDGEFMEITASGEAKGAASEVLHHSSNKDSLYDFNGTKVSIGFNPKYISDVLSAIHAEQVEISFKDSFSPVLIKTDQQSKNCFVVMPVKV